MSGPEWYFGVKGEVERYRGQLILVQRAYTRDVDEFGGIVRLKGEIFNNGQTERRVYRRVDSSLRNKPYIAEQMERLGENEECYIVSNASNKFPRVVRLSELLKELEPIEAALLRGDNAKASIREFGNGKVIFVRDMVAYIS